jgi:hypothetical protein
MTESQIVQTLASVFRPMKIGRRTGVWSMLLGLCLLPGVAHAIDCSNLPTSFTGNQFPTGDFFSNFNNPCYTIALGTGQGQSEYGDLNAQYYTLYYQVDPRYQLIVVGAFPNSRYYSVSLNDQHSALSQTILDTNIVPLTSQYVNPFRPGVPFADGQQFAIPIGFGGTPGQMQTGCMMNGYNVDVNNLDATQRHPGIDWNIDGGFFQQYPNFDDHVVDNAQHTNPNTAGSVLIRAYLDSTPLSYATNPHIIVRDVVSGCAYPAAYALNTLQIVTNDGSTGHTWMDQNQVADHQTYTNHYVPKWCNAPIAPPNQLIWARPEEYVPWTNPDAAYISAGAPAGLPATLAAAGEVMRIRVRVPTTPPTPCTNGCSRSGNEQMRYMSLSFRDANGNVFASIADNAFTQDPNGYATLIVGTGATIPAWITPANGYTFLDLTASPTYQQLSTMTMRHMIPGAGFNCAGQFVPYRTSAEVPAGSLMSDYMPVVDYPAAATLPATAAPLVGPAACAVFPAGQPGIRPACGVSPSPPPAIAAVVTQCPAPGCSAFAAQPNPPVTIAGEGFGSLPDGLPFTGISNYIRITDTTQNWIAGYTGSTCGISISSWFPWQIQLVANLGQSGACPLVAGDNVLVEVWNPQTMVEAEYKVTVAAP